MAEVVLFHHVLGLSPGVEAFADDLRAAGHTVHTPDLFEGRTFTDLQEGVHHGMEIVGNEEVMRRGITAADALPADVYYAGFSMGVMVAQMLAQTRPGTRGAILMYSAIPLGEWGFPAEWPDGVPVQVHIAEGDEDAPFAQALGEKVPGAEIYLYPGDAHLFAERGYGDYDERAAQQLRERVLTFLSA